MKKKYMIVMFDPSETGLVKHPEEIWDNYRKIEASFKDLYPSEESALEFATEHGLSYFSIIPVYY